MAQSALTVTAPNPTPPTNFGNTGATPPNPPNYTKATYLDYADNTKFDSAPPPYYDDGAAGLVGVFATNVAALASGSADTAGGTGNPTGSTAGTPGTYPGVANGTVPASTSAAHEAAGTETSATGAGNINYTYPGGGVLDTNKTFGVGPALSAASVAAGPNASHASSLSPATNPSLTSVAAGGASGGGTATCTATGTNFTRQSVLQVNGITYPTTFTSSTTISCTAPKKATAGSLPVYVITGGVVITGPQNWTFT
jgi:hypothetical protein